MAIRVRSGECVHTVDTYCWPIDKITAKILYRLFSIDNAKNTLIMKVQ